MSEGWLARKRLSMTIRGSRARAPGATRNGGEHWSLFDHKHLLTCLLRGAGIPVVEDLALLSSEGVQRLDGADSTPGAAVSDCLEELAAGRYFMKPAQGEHGRGAFCLISDGVSLRANGEKVDVPSLARQICRSSKPHLLQIWQAQHPEIAELNDNTLNTLRILSVRQPDQAPAVVHAVIRIGRRSSWLDNFHAGGIAMRINLDSGRTRAPAIPLDRSSSHDRHPDTGLELGNRAVPHFNQAMEIVRQSHALFPGLLTVGWDVAIAPKGPCIVEGNLNWDAEIHTFVDPRFRPMMKQMLKRSRQGR